MRLEDARIGFAMCGSYCTHRKALDALSDLAPRCRSVMPILSASGGQDTRFGTADALRRELETVCGESVRDTITATEPIGPKGLLDLLIIAPCTGNTMGKLAAGITDTAITMAAKAHLRNGRPVLIAPSTNDGLSVSLRNLGDLLSRKGYYCVPFRQDDPVGKPASLVADMAQVTAAAQAALEGRQLQPLLLGNEGEN
jgi:dipicolinate synthase subunit B